MYTWTMTRRETRAWEGKGVTADVAERCRWVIRRAAEGMARRRAEIHVEVRSHDGITMDAWDIEDREVARG